MTPLPVPVYEQSVFIAAPIAVVDRCVTERALMQRWLNPLLVCEPIGPWSTEVGGRFPFGLRVPGNPGLDCRVRDRAPGLVEWEFTGFFTGTDRWQCSAEAAGTRLLNRFAFEIPNPLVALGFRLVAEELTRRDMRAQLGRLGALAEALARP